MGMVQLQLKRLKDLVGGSCYARAGAFASEKQQGSFNVELTCSIEAARISYAGATDTTVFRRLSRNGTVWLAIAAMRMAAAPISPRGPIVSPRMTNAIADAN